MEVRGEAEGQSRLAQAALDIVHAALDLEETIKQRIIWYLVNPTELLKVLHKVIR